MKQDTLETWLLRRQPAIPSAFLPHLQEAAGPFRGVPDLLERGVDALNRALHHPGRQRDAAFHLLAADALLTYACELVSEETDVTAGLEELLAGMRSRLR